MRLTKKKLINIPYAPKPRKERKEPAAAAQTEYVDGVKVLNVDVWDGGELICRYFAERVSGKHCGIGRKTGWHTKIKLDNLVALEKGWSFGQTYYGRESVRLKDGDEDTVWRYLGRSLNFWENEMESRSYYEALCRKEARQHAEAEAVIREMPEAFVRWAFGTLGEYAVGTKDDGAARYTCTACGGKWQRKTYFRVRKTICLSCGAKLETAREGVKVRGVAYAAAAAADGSERWILREFRMMREWTGTEWEEHMHEGIEAVIPAGERLGTLYYVDYKGLRRRANSCNDHFGVGRLWPDFGGAERLMSRQQRHVLRALADWEMDVNIDKAVIMTENPFVEYLLKGGLTKLAAEIIHWKTDIEAGGKKSPEEYLGIDRNRIARLRQLNGGGLELAWLQYEQMTGRKVTKETLDTARNRKIDIRKNDYWRMLSAIGSPQGFVHYLVKQAEMSKRTLQDTAGTYADYLRMAKEQNLNIASEIFRKPKDLEAAHDECVRAARREETKARADAIAGKFPEVPEILRRLPEKYDYASGQFLIVSPTEIMDILDEGRALGHCVDTSERYFERIEKRETYLVFLRRAAAPSKPWYTLEIEPGGTIRQQRTTGNRQNKEDQEAYMPFVREWQRQLKEKLTEEDREAQRRSSAVRVAEYRELREKKELVWHGHAKGTLLVDLLEADLVENAV